MRCDQIGRFTWNVRAQLSSPCSLARLNGGLYARGRTGRDEGPAAVHVRPFEAGGQVRPITQVGQLDALPITLRPMHQRGQFRIVLVGQGQQVFDPVTDGAERDRFRRGPRVGKRHDPGNAFQFGPDVGDGGRA